MTCPDITNNSDLLFGERGSNNQSFEGQFDNIKIYNTALSNADVSNIGQVRMDQILHNGTQTMLGNSASSMVVKSWTLRPKIITRWQLGMVIMAHQFQYLHPCYYLYLVKAQLL